MVQITIEDELQSLPGDSTVVDISHTSSPDSESEYHPRGQRTRPLSAGCLSLSSGQR